jgi:protein-tyrosine phosphatase
MTDLSPVAHTPKPPRGPSAGVRSVGSVSQKDDLILGAHKKNLLTKKASSVAESQTSKSALQAEVDDLKRQLRESEKRLSTPIKGNRRPRDSIQAPTVTLQGERYNALPYSPVQQHIMWEPFEDDPEVREHLNKLKESEDRIARRHESWSHEWSRVQRDQNAKIPAPNPLVFNARDDETVLKLAARAEEFASNGKSPMKKVNTDAISDSRANSPSRQNDAARRAATYSPAALDLSRSMSRANSRTGGLQRRTSSLHGGAAQVLNAFGLPAAVDIVLPDPDDVVMEREGDILGHQFVLKRDLFDAAFAKRDTVGVMCGAPGFRLIPRFNIGAVSQAHISGIRTILNEIVKQWDGPIVWVNLREEPVIYLNNRSYIVRSATDAREPLETPGIKGPRLEHLEAKLRLEVLKESRRFGGNVIVHKEAHNGAVEAQWESIDDAGVHTLQTVFEGVKKAGYDVRYVRLPVTPNRGIHREMLDEIFDVCLRHPTDPIIVNCQTGQGRSTVAMLIATIVRFYQHNLHANVNAAKSAHVSMLAREETTSGFSKLAQLVALLPNGHLHELRVSMMCELTGKASNLAERITAAFKTDITPAGVAFMNRYCQLVAFSAYCEARLQNRQTEIPYSKWVAEHKAVDRLLASFTSGEVLHELRSTRGAASESVSTTVSGRRGDILGRGTGLVALQGHSEAPCAIPGVDALRQPHSTVPVFTCGRSTVQGRQTLLYNASENFPVAPRIEWIDVRAEPYVYLNGIAYAAMNVKSIFKEQFNTMHVTGEELEDIEARLKRDVEEELRRHGGSIEVITVALADNTTTTTLIKVSEVLTPRDYAAKIHSPKETVYHRVPFTAGREFNLRSVHPMIDAAASSPTNGIVVIEDSTGGLRSTVALNIFTLARIAQLRPLNSTCTAEEVRSVLALGDHVRPIAIGSCYGGVHEEATLKEQPIKPELMIAASMGQALAAGALLMTTEATCTLCGRGREWNLVDRANLLVALMSSGTGDERQEATEDALAAATMYIYVFLAAVYLDQVLGGRTRCRYEDWVQAMPEVALMIEKMREHPKAGLKFVEPKNLYLETESGSVARRRGNVLTSNYGLKADHFPGAIRKNMVPQVHGVPNFRKVAHVNVYGVGIPTRRGIVNLLRVLGADDSPLDLCGETIADPEIPTTYPRRQLFHPDTPQPSEAPRGRVIWVNMREEPLLYVGDRPFVLRDLANPYVNVEFTGITPSKIEAIENTLREDCLVDAAKYNNQFLIHDEIAPGQMGGLWESGTADEIQTIRMLYDTAVTNGSRVTFVRLPVTDEQMPEIRDFDILIQSLLPDIIAATQFPDEEAVSLVFNCQMGRGRTTTGMAVACMLIGLVQPAYFGKLTASYRELYPVNATKWGNGHYQVINDLLRILVDGRDAKTRVDLVLEACNNMQNLRTAIEMFKDQAESPDASESARARALHHGQHYLMRYFFLIVLNSYLHEAWDPVAKRLSCTFEDYMAPRDELRHFSSRCDLK